MLAALDACPGWLILTAGVGIGAFPRRVGGAFRRYVKRRQDKQNAS